MRTALAAAGFAAFAAGFTATFTSASIFAALAACFTATFTSASIFAALAAARSVVGTVMGRFVTFLRRWRVCQCQTGRKNQRNSR